MNTASRPIISIRNVSKRFGPVVAVDNVSIDIQENEFFALLGPSGCGKTTLLRMIAGLETPSSGELAIDGEDMGYTPPNQRPVNMVFQSYAVFPHMTVAQNVGYGLKVTGTPRREIASRVTEALDMVKLADYGARKPDQLSGGQRQRVALARALVKRPKVLLLDEPLSALDAKLREQMQLELSNLQETVGITFIIVTHDQDEALSMADRIAVMEKGKVCQIEGPGELYEAPNSRFVADFIGKVNLIDARVTSAGDGMLVAETAGISRMEVPFDGRAGSEVCMAVRPEKLRLTHNAPVGGELIRSIGTVRDVAYYGDVSHVFLITDVGGLELSVNVQNDSRTSEDIQRGQQMWVSWRPEDTLVLTE